MNIKLNLAALQHVRQKMKGKNGEVDVLIIPIAANHLFDGQKGVYLDMAAFDLKNPKSENGQTQTHLVKQNLPKEIYSKLTDEQKKQQPIFGNVYSWDNAGNSATSTTVASGAVTWDDTSDDLPF